MYGTSKNIFSSPNGQPGEMTIATGPLRWPVGISIRGTFGFAELPTSPKAKSRGCAEVIITSTPNELMELVQNWMSGLQPADDDMLLTITTCPKRGGCSPPRSSPAS